MRILYQISEYELQTTTLEHFNELFQRVEEQLHCYFIDFNLNPFLLEVYKPLNTNFQQYKIFAEEFTKYLYEVLTPLKYQVTKKPTGIINIGTLNDDFEVMGENVLRFFSGSENTVGWHRSPSAGVVLRFDMMDVEQFFRKDWNKINWNLYFYKFLKVLNNSLITFLLQKSELYSSLDSLSRSMDFRGIFVDEELRESLRKKGRLEEFDATELSKNALNKVAQVMYGKFLTDADIQIRPETKRAIPGDLPPDLIARLKRELDQGADTLS